MTTTKLQWGVPRRRVRAKASGAKLLTGLLLAIALPCYALSSSAPAASAALVLACCTAVYSGWRLASLAFDKARSLIQLTFWLFVYCWLGIVPCVQVGSGQFPLPDAKQSPNNLLFTTLIVIAGIIAYELGVHSGDRSRAVSAVAQRSRTVPDNRIHLDLRRHLLITIACVGASMVAIQSQGGVKAALVTRSEAGQIRQLNHLTKMDSIVGGTLQHVPPMIAMFTTFYFLLYGGYRGRRQKALIVLFLTLLAYNFIANYPPSLARVSLGSNALAFALILTYRRSKLKPLLTLSMIFALTLAFPYMDYFRRDQGYGLSDLRSPIESFTTRGDYDAFQMISNSVAVVNENGIDFGRHLIGAVSFFVPRALWGGKPYGTGQTIGEYLGYRMLNLSCPLWSELFYAGALPALLLGFWLYGYTSRWLEAVANRSQRVLVFMIFAAGFQIFVLRGDLMNAIAYLTPTGVILSVYLFRPEDFLFGTKSAVACRRQQALTCSPYQTMSVPSGVPLK